MPVILIGHDDGQVTRIPSFPAADDPAWTAAERFNAITHDDGVNEGIWVKHRTSLANKPAWIESDDAEFAAKLAAHYGCPVGRPEQAPEGSE